MRQNKRRSLSVLCVDGDADTRSITELSLRLDPRITVHVASSGIKAESLWLSGLDLDLILLDAFMPDISGVELVHRLRKGDHRALPPIVFLTASAQPNEQSFVVAGAAGVITKPFDPLALAPRVRSLLT